MNTSNERMEATENKVNQLPANVNIYEPVSGPTQPIPPLQMNLLQTPSDAKLVEEETSKDIENESEEKLDYLRKQIHQIKGTHAKESVNSFEMSIRT